MVRAAVMPPDARKADVLDPAWIDRELGRYVGWLEAGTPFAHASYRDGEWRAILGHGGTNCDGTRMVPELGQALAESLTGADGIHAAFWPTGDVGEGVRVTALEWLREHRPAVEWLADCPIRRANETGRAAPFFRALHDAGRPIVLVGPEHLSDPRIFDLLGPWCANKVTTPAPNAWQFTEALAGVVAYQAGDEPAIVLLAAGMASELLIHRLWDPSGALALIDVGAILDPYVGVNSRGAYQRPNWPALMARNLP